MNYPIFDPKISAPPHTISRKVAKLHFNHFVESIPQRLNILQSYTSIELDYTKQSIIELDKIFFNFILEFKKNSSSDCPCAHSFSLSNDISMYLGEYLLKQSSKLSWQLCIWGKKNINYHQPVIIGFDVSTKNYGVDYNRILNQYVYCLWDYEPQEVGFLLRIIDGQLCFIK